jgi:hypothetical protein
MKKTRIYALGNALIWVAVLLAAAIILQGTGKAGITVVILAGAAGASIVLFGNALRSGD